MIPLLGVSSERVSEAWSARVPEKYRITSDLIDQNLHRHPLLHSEASCWSDDGFVALKRSAAALYSGPDPKTAHLSLAGGQPDDALTAAIGVLIADGYETLVLGTDSGHFLPGAPTEVAWLAPWLESRGFAPGGTCVDLEADLEGYVETEGPPVPCECRILAEQDVQGLQSFLLREFPGRWHYDVMRKVAAEGSSTVFGLFVEGVCEGFALLQHEGALLPIGGAVWKADLGENWGALGPIGISRALRGKGLGNYLLGAALSQLRRDHGRRTIIDWTGLIDFYGAHGFNVARTYRSYRLSLRADRPPGA